MTEGRENDAYKNIYFACTSSTRSKITEDTIETDPLQQDDENLVTINLNELNQIIAETIRLSSENKVLKETIQRFHNLEQGTKRGFTVIQAQLDKIHDLLQRSCDSESVASGSAGNKNCKIDDEIIRKNLEFPIKSMDQLDLLEDELIDFQFEKALITKFSKVCGTSGNLKISKIGLQLMRCLFTDELLCQLTWKGIKGCTKVPFIRYMKIRILFHKIISLADRSCSMKESDSFLQNSAIKHSGQRIKRKSCEIQITDPKRKKNEPKGNTTTVNYDEAYAANN